ncbi:NYN domain-containing protein [Lachnospiraceae bacterium MD1]|uniref:NYN domain-containing protein n=1 Tax=Variimorphobacter saccharofermentans TaxID=2755051 RepID=A0A839K150_9FIRM|nr:TetM/TetW/TetO/TetS family tetracycline resistance ribosomal protection protein [Variimorphobacter saccharofermentans]MBB2183370.1 NYN domain-containing protein [Variimorphobacter saccharofermentans]
MKRLTIGILAHVDAGKTTLAESILYRTGSIRKLGRVDHKDAFLDTYELERARGITIFSKQAVFSFHDMEVTLLDTPGHADFSAEMERTLQVLDYAILIISGSDGIQGHTETLWRLLSVYRIPTFVFVNKMDMDGTDRTELMKELRKRLHDGCVDFSADQNKELWMENLAMCDEALLDKYMDTGRVEKEDAAELIVSRKAFPCYFGSALKLQGIDEFLEGIEQFTKSVQYPDFFGAKIYKITRDEQGNRITHMKITGGCLKVKMVLTNRKEQYSNKHFDSREKAEDWEEKVDQIRIYSGVKYEAVEEAVAGTICAVTGLSKTYPGEGLGIETVSDMPILEPVLNYQVLLPSDCDAHVMLSKLRLLEEEDPQLHIVWSEHLKEIHVQLMGEIQIEILKSLIMERFGVAVEFGEGNILYKEAILDPVEGVGHFEPLRHYAEVHLLMEPGDPGSGLQFYSSCSEDELDRNWQRLILTHLAEKEHIGVLTGSPITDMRITLIAGRAHLKHTEGGDFRQATYRAVRQGLKKANCILLEPYYSFRLEIPSDLVGRAMSDISRMYGSFQTPETEGEWSVLVGKAPVATMRGYQMEVASYTRGRGKLFCTLKGYEACHNQDEVVAAIGYDSERDLENPTGSVFCAHGAGFVVPWNEVERYQHIESGLDLRLEKQQELQTKAEQEKEAVHVRRAPLIGGSLQEDKELEEIFTRTFGPIKNKTYPSQNSLGYEKKSTYVERKQGEQFKTSALTKEYLLVDGYNIIFAWDELNELAKENMDAARYKLMDILCNYQGFKKCILILVFDAYKVKGGVGSVTNYHGIHVVYTKEAETADMYIEKVTHEIGRRHHITVATSDYVEQIIIMGQGALRLSAQELKVEIARVNEQIRSEYLAKQVPGRNYLGNHMNGELLQNHVDEDGDSLHISS